MASLTQVADHLDTIVRRAFGKKIVGPLLTPKRACVSVMLDNLVIVNPTCHGNTDRGGPMRFFIAALFAAIHLFSPTQSEAAGSIGVLVSCCFPGAKGCLNLGIGYGSGASQKAAISAATAEAMEGTNKSPQWKCSTVRTINDGCAYLAAGCRGQICITANGATHDEAVTNLRSKGYVLMKRNKGETNELEDDVSGGCI